MSYEIRADYNQIYLLPPTLEEFVPSGHPARLIREFVDALNLRELGFTMREGEEGRPYYGESLLLKVWLYGYFNGIRSTRRLEKECQDNMGLIWLTGMHYPDHNTLWRFYERNQKALKRLFKEAVRIAVRGGLVGMVLNAVDGTKVMADVSRKSGIHKRSLEKLLQKVDESVEEVCDQIERAEDEERERRYTLPEGLQGREKLREFVKGQLKELQRHGTDHLSRTDKDARMMKGNEGIRFSYNAQVVVDDVAGIIVGAEVEQSESDNAELVKRVDEVKENVGLPAQETVADAGYFSGEELQKAENNGYGVLVATTLEAKGRKSEGEGAFARSGFQYDEERGTCTCPQGNELKYVGTEKKSGHTMKVFRCRTYAQCPSRAECSRSAKGRRVRVSPYYGAMTRQLAKQRLPDSQVTLKRRKAIVEPVLGHIKHVLGFRRWTVRGLHKVRSQWYLMCTSVNLRKMYAYWLARELRFA